MSNPHFLDPDWWRHAVVYQVYPRSFADADNDGTGDVRGITEKLPYLAELGVDAVWVSPWYPSPLRDGGYDVADFTAVLPDFGTIDEIREVRRTTWGFNVARVDAADEAVFVDLGSSSQFDELLAVLQGLRTVGPFPVEGVRRRVRPSPDATFDSSDAQR